MNKELELLIRKSQLKDLELWLHAQYAEIEEELFKLRDEMKCDLCDNKALYDVRLPLFGAWANVCQLHFDMNGCSLGLGKGQKIKEIA